MNKPDWPTHRLASGNLSRYIELVKNRLESIISNEADLYMQSDRVLFRTHQPPKTITITRVQSATTNFYNSSTSRFLITTQAPYTKQYTSGITRALKEFTARILHTHQPFNDWRKLGRAQNKIIYQTSSNRLLWVRTTKSYRRIFCPAPNTTYSAYSLANELPVYIGQTGWVSDLPSSQYRLVKNRILTKQL